MDKQKFDYYWKIALIVILIFGMIYMFWDLITSIKGLEYHSARLNMESERQKNGISCFYECFNKPETDFESKD